MTGSQFSPWWIAAVLLSALMLWRTAARRRRLRREAYIDTFDFAHLLDRRLARRRPELSDAARARVFAGLREWFQVCRLAGRRRVAMPSQAVDDAWHEFILFTRNYQAFCRHGLGRFLHHVPAEAMRTPTHAQEGIRRTWRLSCRRAGIDPAKPALLPELFAMDTALALADGFHYRLDCLAALGQPGAGASPYCASHIGCSSGCSGGGSCSSDSGGDSGGDGGGCNGSCGGGCSGGGD